VVSLLLYRSEISIIINKLLRRTQRTISTKVQCPEPLVSLFSNVDAKEFPESVTRLASDSDFDSDSDSDSDYAEDDRPRKSQVVFVLKLFHCPHG